MVNDEELRAFLDSATVGEGSPAKRAAREDTAASDTVTPAAAAAGAEPVAQVPAEPVTRESGLSFEELIGKRRKSEPAAQAEPDLVPLVLPSPPSANHSAPGITPLHLPEPTKPNQVASAAPAGQSSPPAPATPAPQPNPSRQVAPGTPAGTAAVANTDEFPPTEALARVDMPPVSGAAYAGATPAVHTAAQPAAHTTPAPALTAEDLFGAASSSDDGPYETISVTGGEPASKRWLPWAIVGGGAAIALLASVLVVGAVTGSNTDDSSTAQPPTSQVIEPEEGKETRPTTGNTSETDEEEPEESAEADPTKPPTVEVGPTMSLPISQWGVTAQLSSRFGQSYYNINASDQLVLNSSLIDSLPESCAAMRQQWGIQRVDGTTYEVFKPDTRCAESPELYDELWGLTAAMVASVTPQ